VSDNENLPGNIIGIGTDIVECLRIAQMIERHGELFINRVYTPLEIRYLPNPQAIHAALRRPLGRQGSHPKGDWHRLAAAASAGATWKSATTSRAAPWSACEAEHATRSSTWASAKSWSRSRTAAAHATAYAIALGKEPPGSRSD